MKKLVSISLFIFCTFFAAILIAGLVFYQNNTNSFSDNSILPSGANDPVQKKQITLNAAEIARHRLIQDCWLLINDKVYDVTSYLGAHPGGVATIAPYCGKDATNAFATKNTGSSHSAYASSLLTLYYLGDLNQNIGASSPGTQNEQNTQNIQNIDPSPQNPAPVLQPTPKPASQTILNAAEIAKHGSINDCWIIINSVVYNVTSYLRAHPGGVGTISPYCGKDATQAFQGQGHSSYASSLLSSYFIGNLNQNIGTSQVQQNVQNTNTSPPPNRRGHDEYEDD